MGREANCLIMMRKLFFGVIKGAIELIGNETKKYFHFFLHYKQIKYRNHYLLIKRVFFV